MKWHDNLYLGETISPEAEQVIRKIKNRKLTLGVYLITFPSNPQNLLDIIPSWELIQNSYPQNELYIVGIAKGKKEAYSLVEQMIRDCYETTGQVDIKQNLLKRRNHL